MSYLSEIYEIKRRAGLMESGPSDEALNKAVQMMIDEIGSGSSYGFDEQMVWEFAEFVHFDHDGDPHYVVSKDPELQKKFNKWKVGYAKDMILNAVHTVEYCLKEQGGLGVVYRMITAPMDWYEKGGLTARNLGEYWACKKENADAHWEERGDNYVYWIITGLIRKQDIDWVPTLFQQAHPDYEDEAEVRVVPGSPVKVIGLERGPEGRGYSNAQYEEVPMRQPVVVPA